MTRKLFGTDGIRGTANQEPMTAETALRVAMATGARFRRGDHRHVVIGKDTRLSGYMLEPALTAGFIAMGMDVVLSGPLPTPAMEQLADPVDRRDRRDRPAGPPEHRQQPGGINRTGSLGIAHLRVLILYTAGGR